MNGVKVRILNGDAAKALKVLATGSHHCCITSPPGECHCCRETDRLSEWLHKNLDEVPAIGPGPAAAAMAVIRKLKGRVAELEAELSETLEDAVRQGAARNGDIYGSCGISAWCDMMGRLVELGRFEITENFGGNIIEGRFLPRKESNGATQ